MKNDSRLVVGLLILTVIIFVGFNINQLNNEIKEKQYDNLVNDLSAVAQDFGIWISNKRDMLDTSKDMVDNFTFEEITAWSTGNPYLNINNDDPDVSQVYVGLNNGDFITGGQWVPPDDYDPRVRTWYIEAIDADDTIISRVYIDLETGDKTVTISSPLYMDGKFVGVIAADLFLNNINDYLKQQIEDDNIYTYLIDGEGVVVVHTSQEDLVGKSLYLDIKLPILIDYFEEVKRIGGPVRMSYDFQGQGIRGIVQSVEDLDWYLTVALVDDGGIFDSQLISLNTLLVNMSLLAIILLLIYLIAKAQRKSNDLNQLLKYESEKDFLTGAYNRRYLKLYMDKCWKDGDTSKDMSLLMMDIDKFKDYNDTYGHIKGDDTLKLVIDCIGEHIRKEDVLARYGGEEFSLVLVGASSEEALKVSQKIRQAVYDMNLLNEKAHYERITLSIGLVTVRPESGISVRDTIDLADKALYEAKASGRNRVVVG